MAVSDALDIFTPRGVADDVRAERCYERYGRGDWKNATRADGRLVNHRDWLVKTLAAPGYAMPRPSVWTLWSVGGDDHFPRPYMQLRPDWPVAAKRVCHTHERFMHEPGDCACGEHHDRPPVIYSEPDESGEWRPAGRRWLEQMSHRAREQHGRKTCDWQRVPREVVDELAALGMEPLGFDGEKHLWPTGHLDPRTGELVVPLDGFHTHLSWAKYRYAPGVGKAAGLSSHPRVIAGGFAAPEQRVIFLALEGVLKCDSIVSAGWPAIEVGSVNLWRREVEVDLGEYEVGVGPDGEVEVFGGVPELLIVDELTEWAATFAAPQGARVAVVADSDWATNLNVRRQVALVVDALQAAGVDAVGCAPAYEFGEALGWDDADGIPMHSKLGVDDYLGALAETDRHDALLAMPVQLPGSPEALNAYVERLGNVRTPSGRKPRSDGLSTARLLMQELQRTAGPTGRVEYRASELAEKMGRDRKRVTDAKQRWEALGALAELREEQKVSGSGGGVITEPALLQLAPDLVPSRELTLGDWLAG